MKRIAFVLFTFVVYVVLVAAVYFLSPQFINSNLMGIDWNIAFYPASRALIEAGNIYAVDGFYNPVWALFPILPFAFLPWPMGYIAFAMLNLFCFVVVAIKMKMQIWFIVPWLIFGGVLRNSLFGNIDGLTALGLILPPQIGLFFVMMKPQIGIPIALFWCWTSYRDGGIKRVAQTFAPVVIAFLISFAVYGLWIFQSAEIIGASWNTSLWPWTIPAGLILLYAALRRGDIRPALISTACLSPYLASQSWAFMWLGVLTRKEANEQSRR